MRSNAKLFYEEAGKSEYCIMYSINSLDIVVYTIYKILNFYVLKHTIFI